MVGAFENTENIKALEVGGKGVGEWRGQPVGKNLSVFVSFSVHHLQKTCPKHKTPVQLQLNSCL